MQMVILSGIVIVLSIFLYVQLEHQTQINFPKYALLEVSANCLSAIFMISS